MRTFAFILSVTLGLTVSGQAQLKDLKPGWNLFSPQQDVQLGREAAAEVERKMAVIRNGELDNYLNSILNRLKQCEISAGVRKPGHCRSKQRSLSPPPLLFSIARRFSPLAGEQSDTPNESCRGPRMARFGLCLSRTSIRMQEKGSVH